MNNWTEGKLKKLTIEHSQELSPNSTTTLLERLNKTNADEAFALRLISYYYKLDNNLTGSKVVNTNAPKYKLEGVLLSKAPRTMGGKNYEADNLYILVLKTITYPETQDRDENICAEGKLYRGQVIEAQQWPKKDASSTMFDHSHVGRTFVFEGAFGSYKGSVQFSVWGFDDTESTEFGSKGETISQFRKDATVLLDDEKAQYKPHFVAVSVETVTIASIWKDGDREEVEYPYFQLNCKSIDNANINLALTYYPEWIGKKGTYGMSKVPIDFSDIFEEAKEEEFPLVYAQSMLEDMKVLVGFTLNSAKPYNDNYTIYGNLFGIYQFNNIEMVQPELEEFFDEKQEQEDLDILSDGFVSESWDKILKIFNEEKKPFTLAQLAEKFGDDDMGITNIKDLCEHFTNKGILINVNNKYGFASHYTDDKEDKKVALIASFLEDNRKNTVAQLATRSTIGKEQTKELLLDMAQDGIIMQTSTGRYSLLKNPEVTIRDITPQAEPAKPKDNALGKQIGYVVKSFGKIFEMAQLVEMVKGAYAAETGNEVSVDDNTLTQLIKSEMN